MYTQEIADRICAELEEGRSLRSICEAEGMPSEALVRKWAANDTEGFYAQYARAREIGYEKMAEEIIEISDDGSRDYMKVGDRDVPDYDHIQRSKLRVDTRKWLLSKMLPKKYGDKVAVTGADDGPIQVTVLQLTDTAKKPDADRNPG